MKSPVCEMLGIEFPLFAFSHCRDVVAAVSRAGGFGVLGATGHTPQSVHTELQWIDDHVGGKPYGIDILVPENMATAGERVRATRIALTSPTVEPDWTASLVSTPLTWSGVQPGWIWSTSAISPEIIGAASEVPLATM